ncbi:unnamed protein product [Urochloa decumbens]|uniref:Uncharacterized protein n=1 Tax=Urochloa decumbens TaxID=240449 RepID=A0ABC9BIN7_9POAL
MEGTGAAAAATPPQALVPAPPARRGAGAAAPRGRLELAADALLCCFTGAMLVCFASCAAFMAARRACGRGSRAAAVAEELFLWSLLVGALLLPLADLAQQLLELFRRRNNEARVAPQVGGGARGRQDALRRSGTAPVFFVSFMCMNVGLLMRTLAPAKDSYMATAGYIVGDVGCFLHSVAFCFLLYQELLVQLRSIYAKLKED